MRPFQVLAAGVLLASSMFVCSCEKVVECDKPHYSECDKEHLPDTLPGVKLIPGEITVESLSFTITPENAASVRYAVYEKTDEAVSAEDLFDREGGRIGLPADAVVSDEYVVSGLRLGTDYVVAVAAHNNIGYSDLVTIDMTTLTPPMSLALTVDKVGSNSVAFTLSPVNASKVAYIVAPAAEAAPAAASVLEKGVAADASAASACVAKNLEPETEYMIYAAALDLAGKESMLAEPVAVKTIAVIPPAVGDFYYSDGSWSTELDETKDPIGIVFYIGVASDYGDNIAYYKQKDGSTQMEEFNGYVIALNDATTGDGVWWSFYRGWSGGANCSREIDDFLGYTNTLSIKAKALESEVGFSDSNESYPAAYFATVGYEAVCPAPDASSGWFLPSAYQFKYIYDKVYFNPDGNLKGWLEQSFETLGEKASPLYVTDGSYWTSTERYDAYDDSVHAYYFNFDYASWSPGFIDWYGKDTNFRVRSVLAF